MVAAVMEGGREGEEGGVRVDDGMMRWALWRGAQGNASHRSPYACSQSPRQHQKRSLLCVRGFEAWRGGSVMRLGVGCSPSIPGEGR